MATLIADRFFQLPAGWFDLATGQQVSLRVGPPPNDIAQRSRHCAQLHDRVPIAGPQLIDYGPGGHASWFEAWTRAENGQAPSRSDGVTIRRLTRPAVRELAQIAATASHQGVERIRLNAAPGAGLTIAVHDLTRALRTHGFVTVCADAAVPLAIRRRLWHRHLVILALTDHAKPAALDWAARASAASNRGHLLIEIVTSDDETSDASAGRAVQLEAFSEEELVAAFDSGSSIVSDVDVVRAAKQSCGWPGRFAAALASAARNEDGRLARVHEQPQSVAGTSTFPPSGPWPFSASSPQADVVGGSAGDLRRDRALACRRRGRAAAGERWMVASVEAQRRRGDARGAVEAVRSWVPQLVASGRWQRAAHMAAQALRDAVDPATRGEMAVAAGWAHLEGAQLGRAEACVETAVCIDELLSGRVSVASAALRAAVRFWQGRWREGRDELTAMPRDVAAHQGVMVWNALLEWANDREAGRRARPALRDATSDMWTWAATVFRAAEMSEDRLVVALQSAANAPVRWRHVIEAQAWLEAGDVDRARRVIRERTMRPVAQRGLADCAAVSIRLAVGVGVEHERVWLNAVAARERLRGLVRWGQGRSEMQMLQDVTKLLEIVQSAEDEQAGLRAVCRWAVEAGGADRCAVVSAPTGDVVVGDSLDDIGVARAHVRTWLDHPAAKLEESQALAHARAPIRYGGSPVGLILAVTSRAKARALFDAVQAAGAVSGALLRARLDAISAAARTDGLARDILGGSAAIESVRAAVARAATAPFSVVVEGESGTGKELVARALHRLSPRRDRTFAALNCAALTDELVEAELFGHARGAFTHAVNARAGLFEEAHLGTLFLDEVGDLSPRAQAKLLRVLQEGEIRRVGENEARAVDVRVVAATNRPLAQLVAEGRFREDLMFRLSVVRITVPPLRDRATDLPELAVAFWRAAARRVGTRAVLGPDALAALAHMAWPGNVRQLQNAMAAIAVAAPATGRVTARIVRLALNGLCDSRAAAVSEAIVPLDEAKRQVERQLVTAALARYTGSRRAAAEALGISRQGLSKAVRRLGLVHAGVA